MHYKGKILFVGNFLTTSGSNPTTCKSLMNRLKERNWQIVYTSKKKSKIFRILDMVFATFRYRNQFDLAHVALYSGLAFYWAFVVGILLKLLRKPFIITLHGGNLPSFASCNHRKVRYLLGSAKEVISPSLYLMNEMKKYISDISLIPNPVAITNSAYRHRKRCESRIMWLRAFHEIYNPTLAIRCLAIVIEKYPGSQLFMVGPDKNDGSLDKTKNLVHSLSLSKHVQFIGGIPKRDVPQWLNNADVFINTTNIDNTPVSVLEAMACGLCIISTDVGGIKYLLEDGTSALLVPPDDPERMACAIQRVLAEPGLASKLSKNARLNAEQYDWKYILPKWEELLNKSLYGY